MKGPQGNAGDSSRNCLCDLAQTIRTEHGTINYVSGRLAHAPNYPDAKEMPMNRIVYIVGAIVIIVALLSFFGLR